MKKALLAAVVLAIAALATTATASSTVRALLTGRDIRDGSLTSADIADHTLKTDDFSARAAAALHGEAGSGGAAMTEG